VSLGSISNLAMTRDQVAARRYIFLSAPFPANGQSSGNGESGSRSRAMRSRAGSTILISWRGTRNVHGSDSYLTTGPLIDACQYVAPPSAMAALEIVSIF
jgi:hypothetical protein